MNNFSFSNMNNFQSSYAGNYSNDKHYKDNNEEVVHKFKPKSSKKQNNRKELKVFFREAYLTDVEDNLAKGQEIPF